MATKRCYYEVLGVARDADDATIRKAYGELASRYHPDRNGDDPVALAMFKEVSEAYQVLRDPDKRRLYDRYGHAGLESQGMAPHFDTVNSILDLFGSLGDLLAGGGRGRRRGGARPGSDVQTGLTITLLEAYRGGQKVLTVTRQDPCNTCGGDGHRPGATPTRCRRCGGRGHIVQGLSIFGIASPCPSCGGTGSEVSDPCPDCRGAGAVERDEDLTIDIPRGVDDGMTLRVTGGGEPGAGGGPAGDLYVVFQVEPHELFVRRDLDVYCEMPVTFAQAALGDTVAVPTLDGEMKQQKLPRGSQTGDELRLSGLGMPAVRGKRRGDLVVRLRVLTPRNLTKKQEELLRELGKLEENHVPEERQRFLDRVEEFFSTAGD